MSERLRDWIDAATLICIVTVDLLLWIALLNFLGYLFS